MAKKTLTTLIDDIDGSEAAESIGFSFRGVDYSIDLNERNAAAFDKAMTKWVSHATRESGRRRPGRAAAAGAAATRRTDLAEIRAWAANNGWEVSTRGRIAADVVEAYDSAAGR